MCGIAGMVLRQPDTSTDVRERLCKMTHAQHHRGPDDEGVYVLPCGRAGLGNNRLAIRDLSPAGHMPMGNTDGTVWITYNGEIYNTYEVRPQLEALGYTFQSSSDTEVILHGYEAWGEDVVERLRGIFAFGILDVRPNVGDGTLFLARDRLGVKPLYYALTPDSLLFGSEIGAILAASPRGWVIDQTALRAYLLLGSVPSPLTIYGEIRALEPGCLLRVSLDGVADCPRRYWPMPAGTDQISRDEAIDRTRALLQEAVRTQLVSDAPLGAFLSGGIDSSAVVSLMRRGTTGTIRTCSISFRESEFDESPYAREAAAAAGAEHVEYVVTADDLGRELDAVLGAMDQPTVDGVNTYFVSRAAHESGLTVALSGLGGDELFGGYDPTFRGVPRLMQAVSTTQSIPGATALSGVALRRFRGSRWRKLEEAMQRPPSAASAYVARRGLFAPREVRSLLGNNVSGVFDPVDYVGARAGSEAASDLFSWTSRAELGVYTTNQLLRDTDVMSMAHSLEVRVPLLDERLVEGVLRLPASVKAGGSKSLLLAALGSDLPESVRTRKQKQGFTFPFGAWLRGPLRERARSMVHDAADAFNLDAGTVSRVWSDFEAGKTHWSRPWAILALLACAQRTSPAVDDKPPAIGAGV